MRHQLQSEMRKQVKIMAVHRPPGGAEQEVPDAWNPNPEGHTNVHLHQRPRRLPEVHAATGPLHRPAHHFPATDAGRLHAESLHWPGLGLQVSQRLVFPDQSGNCRVYMSHNPGRLELKQLWVCPVCSLPTSPTSLNETRKVSACTSALCNTLVLSLANTHDVFTKRLKRRDQLFFQVVQSNWNKNTFPVGQYIDCTLWTGRELKALRRVYFMIFVLIKAFHIAHKFYS